MNIKDKFPKWLWSGLVVLIFISDRIATIQGVKEFFNDINMNGVYTIIEILGKTAQWFYPLLVIYLIWVIASLRNLTLSLEKRQVNDINRMNIDIDTRINQILNNQQRGFIDAAKSTDKQIDNLTEYVKAEIDRVDNFKKSLIPFHIRHQSEILYQHSMLYRLINSSDLTLPAETRKENTLKALRDIFMAISTASSKPVNYMVLKIYLQSAKSILSETTKEYIEESEATYTWQINSIITLLERADTNKALVPEIGEIKKILFKLNKPFEYIEIY